MREYSDSGEGLRHRWRIAGWGAATVFILLPAVAMQVTDEVNWTLADFVLAGALVAGVGAPGPAWSGRSWRSPTSSAPTVPRGGGLMPDMSA